MDRLWDANLPWSEKVSQLQDAKTHVKPCWLLSTLYQQAVVSRAVDHFVASLLVAGCWVLVLVPLDLTQSARLVCGTLSCRLEPKELYLLCVRKRDRLAFERAFGKFQMPCIY